MGSPSPPPWIAWDFPWDRVAGILAFNLGIEAIQMIVVILILPSLRLMSRTLFYRCLRIGGATFAGVASIAWIVERLFGIQTPVDAVVNSVAQHGLSAVSLALRYLPERSIPESRNAEMSA